MIYYLFFFFHFAKKSTNEPYISIVDYRPLLQTYNIT